MSFTLKSLFTPSREAAAEPGALQVFVHIGPYKTGSTSVQDFLATNEEALRKAGILYPRTGRKGAAHNELFWKFGGGELFKELNAEIAASGLSQVIISSEHFSQFPRARAERMAEMLQPAELRPVVVSRRPDKVLLSHWGDRVGYGETRPLWSYASERLAAIDLSLERTIMAWGADRRGIVVPFTEGEDVRAAFAHALGLAERVEGLDLSGETRKRESLRVASVLAIQSIVRSAVEAHPERDVAGTRLAVANGLKKALGRRDESPSLTKLALPRDLVLPVIQATKNPAAAVDGTSWRLTGAHWNCGDIVENASPLMSDDWLNEHRAARDGLLAKLPPDLVDQLLAAPANKVQSGLGRMADEKKLKQALEKAGELHVPRINAGAAQEPAPARPEHAASATRPRVIAQYWSPLPPPPDVAKLMDSWPRVNPDFRYETFDKARAIAYAEERGELRCVDALRGAWHPAMESDLLRLLFLFHEGGYYFDADHEAVGRIEKFLPDGRELLLVRRDNGVVVNNVMAAMPGQQLIERVLRAAIDGALQVKDKENFWGVTGPGLLTREYKHWIAQDPESREPRVTMLQWNPLRNTFHRIYNELPYKAEHWSKVMDQGSTLPN
jgi:mannosyltransferase OCH1-like enzyme